MIPNIMYYRLLYNLIIRLDSIPHLIGQLVYPFFMKCIHKVNEHF
jgi:hypothetical protein